MGLIERRCRVFMTLIPMYLTSLFGVLYLLFPFLPMVFMRRRLFHEYIDWIIQVWFGFAVFLLEKVSNIRIHLHQNKKDLNREFDNSAIIVMNHRTRLDWMFYFCVLYRTKTMGHIKIVLKQGLEKIPGAGWATQGALFIFLKRKWEEDRGHLSFFINYFAKMQSKVHILIFPEGTNLNSWSLNNSDKFAQANQLPQYRQVLHPRTTGFSHIFNEMNENKMLGCVHDVTVAYRGTYPTNEKKFLMGELPEEIHFYIDKFSVAEVNAVGKEKWLNDRWKLKEQVLTDFYENRDELKKFEENYEEYNSIDRPVLYFYPIFWAFNVMLGLYMVYQYAWVRVFLSLSLAFFIYVQMFTKGLQDLIMNGVKGIREAPK